MTSSDSRAPTQHSFTICLVQASPSPGQKQRNERQTCVRGDRGYWLTGQAPHQALPAVYHGGEGDRKGVEGVGAHGVGMSVMLFYKI